MVPGAEPSSVDASSQRIATSIYDNFALERRLAERAADEGAVRACDAMLDAMRPFLRLGHSHQEQETDDA